ncbi:MAG: chromosome segregation protein [Candidatus Accumulibacter phosphatis]|uniref:Chromosome segregation protein n=1 Tax=Candidatus Accumulibacter phosphatis TaxID=327160 RepID=A0A080LVU5_9PROT|nr:MAG: chromosome segregation protein [Candidatus Accumulibacter phosphatis]HRF12938.1 AAA family ATPase [Candidatus Accumulibacter phosphatis]
MTPRITSLTATDFRSLRGTVTVPMDSPVVLIHGRNGAGKTSLLMAMELGLNGNLASLSRLDPQFQEHLVHKEAVSKKGSVSIGVHGLGVEFPAGHFDIHGHKFTGKAALDPVLTRHFSERCYLAQSTLTRLLEIYEDKSANGTALTRFVKELLGLDALDALIDGLYGAGDVRRLRGHAVSFWDMREQLPSLDDELSSLAKDLTAAEGQATQLTQSARERLTPHWPEVASLSALAMLDLLKEQSQEPELQRFTQLRRELNDTVAQSQRGVSTMAADRRVAIETAAGAADAALRAWLGTSGQRMTELFDKLGGYFSDLPSPIQNRPEYARAYAHRAVSNEVARCQQIQVKDQTAQKQVSTLQTDRQGLATRLEEIDKQIVQHSGEAGQLAQALSALVPHVHTEECPVCSRDFGEVSSSPLLGHLTARVASLTQSAGLLSALSRERANTVSAVAARDREIGVAQTQMLTAEARTEYGQRLATLEQALHDLTSVEAEAKAGETLFGQAANAAQALISARAGDQQSAAIRDAAGRYATVFSMDPIGASEPLQAALQRFLAEVSARLERLTAKESARRDGEAALRELLLKQQHIEAIKVRQLERRTARRGLHAAKEAGERTMEQARELLKLAQAERSRVVGQVFNDSLNAAWRDLFVRLAPDEPFIPAFALPQATRGDVEAKLETHYRDGGKGGNPRAMLSAGNLNTAALTLFLALHLSVKPQLPWLIIDDPVQSMDEVHISQFAALLRTLSKQHGRQVIIAVHEKPLFDYLCLELSPAFEGDRLITVELGRTANGDSVANTLVRNWKQDLAIAA